MELIPVSWQSDYSPAITQL